MKKKLGIIIALLVLISLPPGVIGCAKTLTTPTTPTPPPTPTPTPTPEPASTPTPTPIPNTTPAPNVTPVTPETLPTPKQKLAIVGTVSFQIDISQVASAAQLSMGSIIGPNYS